MASKTEICNLALSHIGSSKHIANIDTEKSNEAAICRTFYSIAAKTTLEDFEWPFANIPQEALNLVEDFTGTDGALWNYSYRYPVNAVKIIRIISDLRNDTRQTRIPFHIGKDSNGKLIFTDRENAEVEYTSNITETDKFDASYTLALSYRLAHLIAPALNGADPFKMGDKAFEHYLNEIDKVKKHSGNEEQQEEPPPSEFINARN